MLRVNSGDGLVVGIEGSWGTGKSTVIGFIKRQMSAHENAAMNPIVVDFNPWMVSNTGALVDALVTQIAASIQLDTKSPEKSIKAGQKLFSYIGLLKHLKYLKYIPGTGFLANIAEDAAGMANTIGEGAKAAQDGLTDMEKILPAFDLSKRKAEVVEALHELNRPIVVIVDDLDRLPADEIRVVVQAIKAVADFPRTTYLLAYDREIVAKALGNGDPTAGLAYLEKIVQVAYPIPPLFQHQLRNFADKKVRELLVTLNLVLRGYEDTKYAKAVGIVTCLARHPRDIVRLMNRLILSLPSIRNEVNTIDAIVFEALSLRFPTIRDNVHRHPTDFIGFSFRGDSDDEETDTDWSALLEPDGETSSPAWERHLPLEDADRSAAKRACAFLFQSTATRNTVAPEDELRIADPDRLARYFRMTSLDGVPEASEIHEMLKTPNKLALMLEGNESTDLVFQLEWIFNYLPSCPDLDALGSINQLVNASTNSERTGQLTSNLAELLAKVLERLLRQSPSNKRSECFNLIVTKVPLSISEPVLLKAVAEQGKWIAHPEMVKPKDAQLVPDSRVVDTAIENWASRVRKYIEDGTLVNEIELHAVLFRFAQLNFAYAEVYDVVTQICSTDTGLQKFLSVHTEGSPFNSYESFGLVEDAQVLVNRINSSGLKEQYCWLSKLILAGDFPNRLKEQAARYRGLKRPTSVEPLTNNVTK